MVKIGEGFTTHSLAFPSMSIRREALIAGSLKDHPTSET
jgi:hypothetical protein